MEQVVQDIVNSRRSDPQVLISPPSVVTIPSNEQVHPQHPILAGEIFGLTIKKQPILNPTSQEPVGNIFPQTASQDRSLSTPSSPAPGLSINGSTDLPGRGQARLEAYPTTLPFVPFHLPRPRPPLIEIDSTDNISSAQSNEGASPLTPSSPSLDDTDSAAQILIPIIVQKGTSFQKALTEPSVVSLKLSSLSPLSPSWVKAATNRSPGKRKTDARPTSNKTLVRDVQTFATRPKLVSLN